MAQRLENLCPVCGNYMHWQPSMDGDGRGRYDYCPTCVNEPDDTPALPDETTEDLMLKLVAVQGELIRRYEQRIAELEAALTQIAAPYNLNNRMAQAITDMKQIARRALKGKAE